MPELPEVETIRRDLDKTLRNKLIVSVTLFDKKMTAAANLCAALKGNKLRRIDRRGKLLIAALSDGRFLLIHLKMTGQLIYHGKRSRIGGGHSQNSGDDWGNRFARVRLDFVDGSNLSFNDMRRFGYMKVVDAKEKEQIVSGGYGIEPLTPDFTWENFRPLFRARKTNLKALLLNQKLIAGLGNIYADEVCFAAKIAPWKGVNRLTDHDIRRLFLAITKVIGTAVKNRGTTFRDYVDGGGEGGYHAAFLKVFGRAGLPCAICKTIIKKMRHVGRGTHYCPTCQR